VSSKIFRDAHHIVGKVACGDRHSTPEIQCLSPDPGIRSSKHTALRKRHRAPLEHRNISRTTLQQRIDRHRSLSVYIELFSDGT
jgi:hypothetical protein